MIDDRDRKKLERLMMSPMGIEGATQRIEQIQQRLAQLGVKVAPEASNNNAPAFEAVLQGRLSEDQNPGLSDPDSLTEMVENQAESIGLDPSLAKAVVKAESGFNPNAKSSVGAMGLMQLMPGTAKGLGVESILDPQQNVKGGTKYLKSLINKYHSVPTALAAYNAGPGNVDKFGGVPPFSETQQYVKRVLAYQKQFDENQ